MVTNRVGDQPDDEPDQRHAATPRAPAYTYGCLKTRVWSMHIMARILNDRIPAGIRGVTEPRSGCPPMHPRGLR